MPHRPERTYKAWGQAFVEGGVILQYWQKTAENGRMRQIAAVKGRQLQSRDLQIVYNFKQRCRSSPLLSLALDSHL